MIRCALFALFGICFVSAGFAAETDYSKVDYNQFAILERKQLAKCFTDVLAVVERHRLRNELWDFLYAGCAAEIRSVETALADHPPPGFDGLPADIAGKTIGLPYISSMARRAEEEFTRRPLTFCKGDSCVLDDYRKCLTLKSASEIERRSTPSIFEGSARKHCARSEASARAVLSNEFLAAQRLQQNPDLPPKTLELIDQILVAIRRKAVIAYAEDLVKAVPGHKSCKVPVEMCGASECISLSEISPEQREYECAVASPALPLDHR
ncbi:MAG: hypothetical protein WA418_32170 [Bradyrhizobium sp.]